MKKFTALLLSILLVCSLIVPASAYTSGQKPAADALYSLKLFLGYGNDANNQPRYGLDDSLTREQGVVLLLRMLGKESEAKAANYSHPFTDVSNGYGYYVGYAYKTGLTNGTGATTFSGTTPMTLNMFLTFCLRTLGYSDSGSNPDFQWDKSTELAAKIGIIDSSSTSADASHASVSGTNSVFTRGDTVCIFWNTLNAKIKGTSTTLASQLIAAGLFTQDSFNNAITIQSEGKVKPSACSHESVTGKVTTEPTCSKAGVLSYICDSCGQVVETETIDKLEHSYKYECDETNHWKVCTLCGERSEVEAHSFNAKGICTICGCGCDHEYAVTVTEPTCTAAGYTTHTCKLCGYSYKDCVISATGHHLVTTVDKAATCTEDGYAHQHCTKCDYVSAQQIVIAALGHSYVDGVCTRCGGKDPSKADNEPQKATDESGIKTEESIEAELPMDDLSDL